MNAYGHLFTLAVKSFKNRRLNLILTLFAMSLSICLLLAVERIREDARTSFTHSVSGTDLIVGSRSGAIQLLLYSIFHIGNATNNISWESYQKIHRHSQVKWTIPISLGDSHRGYRVVGTTQQLFDHYRYGDGQPLAFRKGQVFDQLFDAVIGAEVAKQLGYEVGTKIVVAHGQGRVSFINHDDKPFTVSGILAPSGTPLDRAVMISLRAIEAIHIDWKNGVPDPSKTITAKQVAKMALPTSEITAFMLGMKSRIKTFQLQRSINEYLNEPLLAILPGVALQELWRMVSTVESALFTISILVIAIGLLSMLTMLLTSLNERRREMAILRAIGARPSHIFSLLISESMVISLSALMGGIVLFYAALLISRSVILDRYGMLLSVKMLTAYELGLLLIILFFTLLVSIIPAYQAYRYSLADGLTIKV